MKSIKYLTTALVMLLYIAVHAQIKNAKTETVKIYGNCGMCETTIEKAGNSGKVAQVDWDKDTKMASITYDTGKTNRDEILKRIALAGYDSEKFLAPDNAYAKLPECCQYERTLKPISKNEKSGMDMKNEHVNHNHSKMVSSASSTSQNVSQLQPVFNGYFALKDALVKSDGDLASSKAKELLNALNTVQMNKLSTAEHTVWMKVMKDLASDTEHISDTKETGHQRDHFMSLSKNMYELVKISKHETPVYHQNCPMYNDGKGAKWLSKENAVKNPYYGSNMLTCGSTVETIK